MRASLILLAVVSLVGDARAAPAADETALRVAVLRYFHETCTFCPGGDTEVADWTRIRPPLEGDEVLEAGSYIRGFVDQARESGDLELVGVTSPDRVFGGSSRSWNSEESFDHFLGLALDDLRSKMPVDGVYLALHGALAVRNVPRPEAEIARRIRALVGDDVAIVGTFDLHGNEDQEFLRWADGAFVTKRYPHYDAYLQGGRAARYLRRVMRGEYRPTTASRKPPILTATVVQWTGASPSMDIMERARRWEARQPGAYVSVFYGYPWSDVPDVGTTVHVMTDDDQDLAERIADDMESFIWRVREDFAHGRYPMPDEAVRKARRAVASGQVPVVLGDYSDRPGDATWILRQLLDQGVSRVLYATLRDEHALEALAARGATPGDPFDMEVGGFTGPQAGEPVRVTGTLRYFGPRWSYEQVAVVEHGAGNLLVITPAYHQIVSPQQLRFGGIVPDDYDVFVVKSRVHFRRGFDETGYAKTILVVDAPGPWVGTTRLDALDYQHAPIDRLYPWVATPAQAPAKPRIVVLTTGGTIASQTGAAMIDGASLVEAVPELAEHADVVAEELSRIGSSQMTPDHWLRLSKRVNELFREDPDLTGVVVTHGTDTLDETAFFLNLTVHDPRPVVVVGAMRSTDEISADGPANLLNAVRVASSKEAPGKGVLVVLNEDVSAARDVWKSDNRRVHAFRSPELGHLGHADPDRVVFYRTPVRPHTAQSEFDVGGLSALPHVEMVADYTGFDGSAIEALLDREVDGLVVATFAGGRMSAGARRGVEAAVSAGLPTVLASRVPGGRIVGQPSGDLAVVVARDLPPHKARILLALCLTRSREVGEVQRMFDTY